MCDGPKAGLTHIDAVLEHGELAIITWRIPPAQICTAGSAGQLARSSYEKALSLTQQEPERQFLQARIRQVK